MNVIMDIIVATIIGAVITLITINANLVIRETWASYSSETIIQQALMSNAQIVESEFRNMGCGVTTSSNQSVIMEALDTSITFRMALRPELGTAVNVIKYYTGSVNELASTDNPKDRFLYRRQDLLTPERVGVVTRFSLKYFTNRNDTLPAPVIDLFDIGLVEVTMEVQSSHATLIDDQGKKRYTSALWKQTRLASQNLRR